MHWWLRDEYARVCRLLPRLCPRLVPRPLWGVSLARAARLRVDSRLTAAWFSLPRSGRCVVCGAKGSHWDEEWVYSIEGSAGYATLWRLRLLCRRCHYAKHLGYAAARGGLGGVRWALAWLAAVNGVGAAEVVEAARLAFRVWSRLSGVAEWVVIVEARPPGLPRSVAEAALAKLIARRGS